MSDHFEWSDNCCQLSTNTLPPSPDSNWDLPRIGINLAVNALPYSTSSSGISVLLQTLSIQKRVLNGIIQVVHGYVKVFYRSTSFYARRSYNRGDGRIRTYSALRYQIYSLIQLSNSGASPAKIFLEPSTICRGVEKITIQS